MYYTTIHYKPIANNNFALHSSPMLLVQVELDPIRQLVEDISCLSQDLDLRLMLRTKRILKNLDVSSCWNYLDPHYLLFFGEKAYVWQTHLISLAA
jgi:hypothetical protein